MKQVGNILLVEVPEGTKAVFLKEYKSGWHLEIWDKSYVKLKHFSDTGDWQLLRSCTADKLSIDDAKIAMPGFSTRDYTSSASCSFAGPDAKLKSLLSLVRSQGYEPPKVVILVKID
jgi:hypothetical protein